MASDNGFSSTNTKRTSAVARVNTTFATRNITNSTTDCVCAGIRRALTNQTAFSASPWSQIIRVTHVSQPTERSGESKQLVQNASGNPIA